MPDVEFGELRKVVEKKKHLEFESVMKKFIGAIAIIKRILDLGVNLTFGKLLASALVIEKQIIKAITKDKAIQF